MIGMVFLKPHPEDRLSRLVDKCLGFKYGVEYHGYCHVALHFGSFIADITTSGIYTGEPLDDMLFRFGDYCEFILPDGKTEIDVEYNIILRVQKELENKECLIEDELIDWYFDPTIKAYTCTTFVLEMLGLNNLIHIRSPQTLFDAIKAQPGTFIADFAQGNGVRLEDVEMKWGTCDDYLLNFQPPRELP